MQRNFSNSILKTGVRFLYFDCVKFTKLEPYFSYMNFRSSMHFSILLLDTSHRENKIHIVFVLTDYRNMFD